MEIQIIFGTLNVHYKVYMSIKLYPVYICIYCCIYTVICEDKLLIFNLIYKK